jgi:hypothetical protein
LVFGVANATAKNRAARHDPSHAHRRINHDDPIRHHQQPRSLSLFSLSLSQLHQFGVFDLSFADWVLGRLIEIFPFFPAEGS